MLLYLLSSIFLMAISRTVKNQLEKGDYEAVESEWLAHSSEHPTDVDYFAGLARALAGHSQEERARLLLELLDEQLQEQQLWQSRLQLLRRVGHLLADGDELHAVILSTLEKLYGDSPSFAGLLDVVGLHRATHDIPKTWEKVERLETLLALDQGTVVWMEGKGAGRVTEVNLDLQKLKIQMEGETELTVGFKGAGKLLRPLPPDHLLRRKIEEPEVLRRLAEERPPDLLRQLLQSYQRPLTATEIRQALSGVVAEETWSAWWAGARKHPQVVAGSAGRQSYTWAESSEQAVDAVWQTFRKADPRRQIEQLRREGQRDAQLATRMAAELEHAAEEAIETDPGLALEIRFALQRSGHLQGETTWSADQLLAERPLPILRGIKERQVREWAYRRLRELHRSWPDLYADAMSQEEDGRLLALLFSSLEEEAAGAAHRVVDKILAHPAKAPATFVWLAERALEDNDLRRHKPWRLLQQILLALRESGFSPFHPRLRNLCESGGTVPRLLSELSSEEGQKAMRAVDRASALEPYQRDALKTALQLRFPELRPESEAPLYATPAAIAARREELEQLLRKELPANRKAIEEARALGDLRENFEYKSARQRHEYLSARVAALERDLSRARPIDPTTLDTSEVRVGTRVELDDGNGRLQALTILGPWESRPEDNIISYESELGRALLGSKVGDGLEHDGKAWTIVAIERATDEGLGA